MLFTDVLFSEHPGKQGDLGIITLNRPKALNSLTHAMIKAMYHQLQQWREADHIKAIIIQAAEGRAFCAGGDIKSVYEGHHEKRNDLHLFFQEEYRLNKLIFHYPKPYIALLNGITMGGGVGVSIHGSYRLVTENVVFAMPETGIGFFPDVGGTYFLPRLPHHLGYYLGLTGEKINSDDCVALKLAHYKVSSSQLNEIITAIAEEKLSPRKDAILPNLFQQFSVDISQSELLTKALTLEKCFRKDSIETILSELEQHADTQPLAINLLKKSPTSLKVSLNALKRGSHLHFDECMQQEFVLVQHFLQGHDFIEGIRALLIHKDQKPDWQPKSLENVSETMVNNYFKTTNSEII